MKVIKLTKGLQAIVSDLDYSYLNKFKWCVSYSGKTIAYAVRRVNKRNVSMQNFLLNPAKNYIVDHINGDTLDNRRKNLRICNRRQNNQNRNVQKNKKNCKYKGVYWDQSNKKYKTFITSEGKDYWIGRFKSEKEAALAYNKKAVELFGKFAKLNKVD